MTGDDQAPRARVFVALWPDDAVRAELHTVALELQAECGGRAVQRHNLHLTLVFLGNVARDRLAEIVTLMAQPTARAFTLEFGRTGYWRHNRIVWAAPLETPEPLRNLAQALQQKFSAPEFRLEKRPHAAHATLIRDARPPRRLPTPAFTWKVENYALMESVRTAQGPRYEALAVNKLKTT